MKKIVLGMMAVTLAFSAMAQTTSNNNADQNTMQQSDAKHRHSKGGGNLDKLNLSDDQKAQMKTMNEGFRQQMQDLRKQGNLTVDEQKQKRAALAKDHKEKMTAILTPTQRQQAKTMKKEFKARKKDGVRRENIDKLTKDLNLTPDQSAKMASVNSSLKTNIKSIRKNVSLTQDEKKEQVKSLLQQHKSEVNSLLTNEQKEQLKSRQKNRADRTAVK